MKSSRVLIKLGGAALKDDGVLDTVTEALLQYRRYGYQVILVHGGGPAINAELSRRGVTWTFLKGQRVTTPEMMDVIEGTLCGQVNRKLVRHFGSRGLPSFGFSGIDGKTLLCTPQSDELGRVGEIQAVDTRWVENLLAMPQPPLPVIAPIGVGAGGESYNLNADWAASRLAVALKAKYLIFLTDQKGILNSQGDVWARLRTGDLKELVDKEIVTDGMLTKTNAVISALSGGVGAVRVMDAKESIDGLWSNHIGTWCLPEPRFLRGRAEVRHAAV